MNNIDIDFVNDILNDVKEHLENINKYDEDTYLLTESDVNKALKDCDAFIDSQSKTLLIHFPNIEYDNDIKPITDFQKVYTLLIDFTSSKNLLEEIRLNKEKRTCMNLGKLKKYLRINEDSKGIKNQFDILYDKIMSHSEEIDSFINMFQQYILSNLILQIYDINKDYLNNKNLFKNLMNIVKER